MQAHIISELENNYQVFKSLFSNQTKTTYLWRPKPDKWNLLEIVCHLYDEELDDFRYRTQHILEHPEKPMPSIDPTGWVLSRNYADQYYHERLSALLEARQKSIAWLRALKDPKWDNYYTHPVFGKVSAQLYLNNWLAHDYLHIRQVMALKFAYLEVEGKESLAYAGGW